MFTKSLFLLLARILNAGCNFLNKKRKSWEKKLSSWREKEDEDEDSELTELIKNIIHVPKSDFFTAVKTGLYNMFSEDEIMGHSTSGKKGLKGESEAKPHFPKKKIHTLKKAQ